MSKSKSQYDADRAGNEVVFRNQNEKVQQNIDEFNATAKDLGEVPISIGGDEHLHFHCECSDENCAERIKVSISTLKKIHEARDVFVVKPNHVVHDVETAIKKTDEYWIIKKYEYPPQNATELKTSGLDHSS